jgi:transcriptional activator SPT7
MAAKTRLPPSGKIPQHGLAGPTSSPQKRTAPPGASKTNPTEPSKKKSKKNSGTSLDMPNFNADGEGDKPVGDSDINAQVDGPVDGPDPMVNGT